MFGFLKNILGSKSDKDLKDLYPMVDKINSEFDKLKNISDDELRNKTFEFKEIIQNNLKDSNQVIDSLREKYKKSDGSLSEKENILNEIDSLKESQKEIIERTLNELLPEAFAVVKETARRFTENESLEVTASDFDRELASKKDNIEIDYCCSTDGYISPELNFEPCILSHKSDIYAVGVIMTEIWFGYIDHSDYKEARNYLLRQLRIMKNHDPDMEKIIRKCVVIDPDKRPDIYKLLKMVQKLPED